MKKIAILSLFAFVVNASAQVALVHTYDSSSYYYGSSMYMVKLEVDGDKFVCFDRGDKELRFYNLNHSHWKTISLTGVTALGTTANSQNILYISQRLFNTDEKIEFLYTDRGGNPPIYVTQVVNEDGSIMFTTNHSPIVTGTAPQIQLPIYNTSAGTFMILSGGVSDSNAYVYSLGGTLATTIGIKNYKYNEQNDIRTSMAYPNPTKSFTTIDYTLPNGVNAGVIVFYDTQGQEVKRFNVDKIFNNIVISTEDLNSGLYYYSLQTTNGISESKKLISIK